MKNHRYPEEIKEDYYDISAEAIKVATEKKTKKDYFNLCIDNLTCPKCAGELVKDSEIFDNLNNFTAIDKTFFDMYYCHCGFTYKKKRYGK